MKEKHYEVTWYDKKENLLNEETIQQMKSYIQTLSKTIDAEFTLKDVIQGQMIFDVRADENLNLNKALRILEKKMSKKIGHIVDIRIISFPDENMQKGGRILRLIKDICDVGYYDLQEFFGGDLKAFKAYLQQRKLGIIEYGERIFLVDIEGIKHRINLNCFECTKKHPYGCCCGSPCDMSKRNKLCFDVHEAAIAEEVKKIDSASYNIIKQTGGFVFFDGHINECNGHCALLVCHEGSYKCISHKYALEHQISIYEICPLSCLMYPLEIMTLFTDKQKRIMYITSAVEEDFATTYGRWGSYKELDVELRCINEKLADDTFKKEDYKPIYEVNKGLLTHEFGEAVYEGIMTLCNGDAGCE